MKRTGLIAGLLVAVLGAAVAIYYAPSRRSAARSSAWEQLTFFTDAAVYPALSPDGRMLAFIRGSNPFLAKGELYVKLLPSGNAVQLTHDGATKLEPIFSPDGSRIVYGTNNPFDSWEVPVLGGQPVLRWKNASSLSWIDGGRRLLFSEIRDGIHMVLVTANAARGETRDVYVPPGDRTMVHHSYLSPDGRFVSMVVMNQVGQLGPCELVPFEGGGPAQIVGPKDGVCVSAAWSRDGKWVYVSSSHGGAFHIWRQRFPDGPLEQVTSGATEETGIAMSADGASMLTSVGVRDATIWYHDAGGDHQLSSEARAYDTRISTDGSKLYYLQSTGSDSGLWVRNLAAGTSDLVVSASAIQPGSEITRYAISRDDTTAALAIADGASGSRIWLVPMDRRSSPRRLESQISEDSPVFLPDGDLLVRRTEGGRNYAYRIDLAGGGARRKFVEDVIIDLFAASPASPDGRWVALGRQNKGADDPGGPMLYPMDGGPAVRLCTTLCIATWDVTGKFLYIAVPSLSATFMLPVNPKRGAPDIPAGGYTPASLQADTRATRLDAQVESASGSGVYSYTRETTRRNIYRIPLPD